MGIGRLLAGAIALAGLFVAAMQVPDLHDRVFGADTSEMNRVVSTLDTALGDSHRAHTRLVGIIKAVNGCHRWPADAAGDMRGVIDERQQGADLVAQIPAVKNDTAAQGLIGDFAQMMITSKAADTTYAAWLKSWNRGYLKIKRGGCHIPRNGILWRTFSDADESAGDAKRAFLKHYGKQTKYGASTWGAAQI
jgi:hypothetical protein